MSSSQIEDKFKKDADIENGSNGSGNIDDGG